jgi:hypothetical protein
LKTLDVEQRLRCGSRSRGSSATTRRIAMARSGVSVR